VGMPRHNMCEACDAIRMNPRMRVNRRLLGNLSYIREKMLARRMRGAKVSASLPDSA